METFTSTARFETKVFSYIVSDLLSNENNYFIFKVEENQGINKIGKDINFNFISLSNLNNKVELKTDLVLYPGCMLEFSEKITEDKIILDSLEDKNLVAISKETQKINAPDIKAKVVFVSKDRIELKIDRRIYVLGNKYYKIEYSYLEYITFGMQLEGIKIDRKTFFGHSNKYTFLEVLDIPIMDLLSKDDADSIKRIKLINKLVKIIYYIINFSIFFLIFLFFLYVNLLFQNV